MTPVDDQRRVASLLLAVLGGHGFALAGAGAIREHGFTGRPTEDVDLFAFSTVSPQDFADAVARAERELRSHGYSVVRSRSFPLFVRVHVTDAVAGKLSAVYSRGELRDFLDLDAIRRSGRYSDGQLLALGREHDAGFDPGMFAQSLAVVSRFSPSEASEYGVNAEDFEVVRSRTQQWAVQLRTTSAG